MAEASPYRTRTLEANPFSFEFVAGLSLVSFSRRLRFRSTGRNIAR